jgi:hypothetical protein
VGRKAGLDAVAKTKKSHYFPCLEFNLCCLARSRASKLTELPRLQYFVRLYLFIYLICLEELPQQWKESIIIPITKKVIRLIVIIIEKSPSCQLPTKFHLTFFWPG